MKPTLWIALLLVSSSAWAQDGKVWTGVADDRWENGANWTPEGAPGKDSTVYVGPVKTKPPILRRTTVLRRLLVEENATLTIQGERVLYVTERLEVNGTLHFGEGAVETEGALTMGPKGRMAARGDAKQGKAKTTTWTGTVSNVWMEPRNWSLGVPSVGYSVNIPQVSTNFYPTVTPVTTFHSLYVAPQATLTVGSGVTTTNIVIDGTLNVTGDASFVVLEDATVGTVGALNLGTSSMTIGGTFSNSGVTNFSSGTVTLTSNYVEAIQVYASAIHLNEGHLSFSPESREHVRTWRGKPDGDWHDPKNWEPAEVPGPNDEVFLRTDPVLSKPAAVKSLKIEPSGALILRAKLEVKEDLDVQGELRFEKGGDLQAGGLFRIKGGGSVSRK